MKIKNAAQGIYVALVLFIGLAACKKDSDLILSPDELPVGSYLILDAKGNDTLFLSSPNKEVSLTVHSYGEQVDKVTVFVSTNNTNNKSTWKKVKEFTVDQSQKVTLSVTPAQIATALGSPIPNGAEYTLYNEITTKGGKLYSLANTNSEFESAPDYNMGMRWKVFAPCTWENAPFTGDAVILEDNGWADYSAGEVVPDAMQPGPGANQIKIRIYPSPAYGTNMQWVTVDVNPTTLAPSISEQYIGDYGSVQATMKTTSPGGTVNPCTKTITIKNIIIGYGGTPYGPYTLVFKKK